MASQRLIQFIWIFFLLTLSCGKTDQNILSVEDSEFQARLDDMKLDQCLISTVNNAPRGNIIIWSHCNAQDVRICRNIDRYACICQRLNEDILTSYDHVYMPDCGLPGGLCQKWCLVN